MDLLGSDGHWDSAALIARQQGGQMPQSGAQQTINNAFI
jgi:hypothetical protein